MLIEIELAAIVALQAAALVRSHRRTSGHTLTLPKPAGLPTLEEAVARMPFEVVKRVNDEWHTIGHRHAGHPDLHEARATPGLAIRHADGSIEEGRQ